MRAFLVLALCGGLAGCGTELAIQRAGTVSPEGEQQYGGVPYPMMMTTFHIEVTHRVVSCDKGVVQVATSAEIKSAITAPDMANMFLVDPNSLSGPFKSGAVKLTYLPNGAVAALNASADDKSVAVAANVIGGLIKVASIGLGNAGAPGVPIVPKACPESVTKALTDIATAEPALDLSTAALEKATASVKEINERLAAAGAQTSETTRAELAKGISTLNAAQASVKKNKAAMTKLLNRLAIVKSIRWPSDTEQRDTVLTVSLAESKKWGDVEQQAVRQELAVGLSLENAYETSTSWKRQAPGYAISVKQGLPYRLPQPGRLRVCAGPCSAAGAEIYAQQLASVLQLGDVYYLPCKSPAFTSSSCELSYADSGELKTMGAARTAATAEAASTAFKDAATQYSAYRIARSDAETKAKGNELAALKAQAELAAAKAALVKGPNQDVISQTSSVKAAVDLAVAELALIEAEAALSAARAP